MYYYTVVIVLLGAFIGNGFPVNEYQQNWGYVSVRSGANLFYWTYFAKNYESKPLILWLQGGPGTPASGVGNFLEIGPNHMNGEVRPYSWIHNASLLFVDSPVGTGFSFIEKGAHLARNSSEVAADLLTFLKVFYIKVSTLQKSPLYIFGENYGGRIAVELAVLIKKMQQKGKRNFELAGIALGGAWISPVEATAAYGHFLYSNSLIDSEDYIPIKKLSDNIRKAIEKNEGKQASVLWSKLLGMISHKTNGVNFLNILSTNNEYHFSKNYIDFSHHNLLKEPDHSALWKFMNTQIKQKLRLPANVTWNPFERSVFEALFDDLMMPSVKSVEFLLNTTQMSVLIYNGQLDLFMPSVAVESWISQMHWLGVPMWRKSNRIPIVLKDKNETIAFKKSYKNLTFKWILRAGNMVPYDASLSAFYILKALIGVKE